MSAVTLLTASSAWQLLGSSNFTDASFATLKTTLTKPSGAGVLDFISGGVQGKPIPNSIILRPFGTANSNDTFKMRVWAWSHELSTGSWENQLLGEFLCTLGNVVGVASCAINASNREADTIAKTYGSDVDISINSPANDVRGAYVRLDLQGGELCQVQFDMNSSATGANALYRTI